MLCININSLIHIYIYAVYMHIYILSGMYDYSSLGEIICQHPLACKNLVQEFQHLNKYWNAKKKS